MTIMYYDIYQSPLPPYDFPFKMCDSVQYFKRIFVQEFRNNDNKS